MRHIWYIGIDEVGRGPLAGPITLAAVAVKMPGSRVSIFDQLPSLEGIRDSKKLSPARRQVWDRLIRRTFAYAITSVHPKTIDARGISLAAHLAVERCLKKLAAIYQLEPDTCVILLDGGLRAPKAYEGQKTIIKGDERVSLIAAASIVAKVYRDAYMRRLHRRLPAYGFDRHKGYGTAVHQQAIRLCGLSPYHRATFCSRIVHRENLIPKS
jgi:ribonuclease HII